MTLVAVVVGGGDGVGREEGGGGIATGGDMATIVAVVAVGSGVGR